MILTLHTNTRTGEEKRRWPHFPELTDRLLEMGAELFFTGTASESDAIEKLMRGRRWTTNLAGKTDIRGLVNILKISDCFITVNSFPMHLAICKKIPTVAIVGGTPAEVVCPKIPSLRVLEDPGLKDYPKYTPRMGEITVEAVLIEVKCLMRNK